MSNPMYGVVAAQAAKLAHEKSPTTRETADHIGEANEKVTADHAELARLAEAAVACAKPDEEPWFEEWQFPHLERAEREFIAVANPSRVLALLSEIAALRGELTETRVAADLLVSSVRADLRQPGSRPMTATSFGWAVLYPESRGFGCAGAPAIDSVSFTRESAMHNFVASWRTGNHDGMTASKVWQRAYRRGWRLARVSITPALGSDQ